MFVEEGESVTEGDILMRLDTTLNLVTQQGVLLTEIDIKHGETRLKNIERQLSRRKSFMKFLLAKGYENLQNARDCQIVLKPREAYKSPSIVIDEDRLNKACFALNEWPTCFQ